MIGFIIFNIVMLILGFLVKARLVSASRTSIMLDWLHGIIGITPPAPEKAPVFALIWIASLALLVDGLLFLLVFLTRQMM